MDKRDIIQGVYSLTYVPFKEDGEIDYETFENLVDYLGNRSGADGVGLWGLVSEYYKLEDGEKDKLSEIFASIMKNAKAHSLISVTHHSTEVAVKWAKKFEKLGVDTLMLLPPSFLNPSIDEIRHHMFSVLGAVDIPVLVQYAPQVTGYDISDEELAAIAVKYDNTAYKIEYKPPVEYMKRLFSVKNDLYVLGGYGGIDILEQYALGVRGVMPGCGYTELYVAEYHAYQNGDLKKAQEIHQIYAKYLPVWMETPEILLNIDKEIMFRRGLLKNPSTRRPRYHPTPDIMKQVDSFLEEASEYVGNIKY